MMTSVMFANSSVHCSMVIFHNTNLFHRNKLRLQKTEIIKRKIRLKTLSMNKTQMSQLILLTI